MKKILAILMLTASATAMAQHHGHHGQWHRSGPGWGWWVAPVITGAVVYEIARNQQPIIVQQPVIVQSPQMVYQTNPNCGPWLETQHQDGTVTRTRTCSQ